VHPGDPREAALEQVRDGADVAGGEEWRVGEVDRTAVSSATGRPSCGTTYALLIERPGNRLPVSWERIQMSTRRRSSPRRQDPDAAGVEVRT